MFKLLYVPSMRGFFIIQTVPYPRNYYGSETIATISLKLRKNRRGKAKEENLQLETLHRTCNGTIGNELYFKLIYRQKQYLRSVVRDKSQIK